MANGWRGYLEEESEFQWIAMAGFLVFILLGALAIQGTSNLPGVEVDQVIQATPETESSTLSTPAAMRSPLRFSRKMALISTSRTDRSRLPKS